MMKPKKIVSSLILCTLSLVLQSQLPKTPQKVSLKDGDTFVFIGNSITHQCLYTQYVENYYFTRYPNLKINFINAGVSGDLAGDVLVRLEEDVVVHQPKYATVLIGMNDGKYEPWSDTIFMKYKTDMTDLTDRLTKASIQSILLTPTLFDTRQALQGLTEFQPTDVPDLHYDATLAYFGAWNAEVASKNGYGLVDLHGDLTHYTRKARQADADYTFISDAIHPEEGGHLIMALSILNGIEADPLVSEILIDLGADGEWKYSAKNGIIQNGSKEEIDFEFTANALPWVVPEDAQMAYELSNAGSQMSQEILRAVGLPFGNYEVLIEDQLIGSYSHLELAGGVALQENQSTPQYKQALELAEINKTRNDSYLSRIRNNWLLRKELWQTKNGLYIEEEEDQEEYYEEEEEVEDTVLTEQERLEILEDEREEALFTEAHEMGFDAYLEKKFDQRNQTLAEKANELLEQIRKLSQPKKLRYTIRKKDSD